MAFFDMFFRKQTDQPHPLDALRPKATWEPPAQPEQIPSQERQTAPQSSVSFDVKKIALYAGIGAVALGIVIGAVVFVMNMEQKDAVAILLQSPVQSVAPGATTTIMVLVQNTDQTNPLHDISLIAKADAGTVFPETKQLATTQRSVDPLQPNQTHIESFSAVFWGKQGDARSVEFVVRYKIGTLNTRFEKTLSYTPHIASDAASIRLQLPQQVVPNQQFTFSAQYANTGTQPIDSGAVRLDLPQGFVVRKTDPETNQQGSLRTLAFSQMDVGADERVTVQGSLNDNEGQGKRVGAHVIVMVRNAPVELASAEGVIEIINSPLALTVSVNNNVSSLMPGDSAVYTLAYQNNSSEQLKDVVMKAYVTDPWFIQDSIEVRQGSFSSRDKVITWNGGTSPGLLVLNPGQSGTVSFGVQIRNAFTGKQTNNAVTMHADISASNVSAQIGTALANQTDSVTNINGTLRVDAWVLYKDTSANGFANTGPIPLRVNQTTQYSAHIKISAQGNDFSDVSVQTVLPPGVTFSGDAGKIKGDTQGFVYNARTSGVTWTIPRISAYTTKELVFQIQVVPSLDQADKLMTLLDRVVLNGTDAFTQNRISGQTTSILSNLPDDPSVGQGKGIVLP